MTKNFSTHRDMSWMGFRRGGGGWPGMEEGGVIRGDLIHLDKFQVKYFPRHFSWKERNWIVWALGVESAERVWC